MARNGGIGTWRVIIGMAYRGRRSGVRASHQRRKWRRNGHRARGAQRANNIAQHQRAHRALRAARIARMAAAASSLALLRAALLRATAASYQAARRGIGGGKGK